MVALVASGIRRMNVPPSAPSWVSNKFLDTRMNVEAGWVEVGRRGCRPLVDSAGGGKGVISLCGLLWPAATSTHFRSFIHVNMSHHDGNGEQALCGGG